jgi:hypothetical protein
MRRCAVSVPASTPPGFIAQEDLVLDCPVCEEPGQDEGWGNYRCEGREEHEFQGGICLQCGYAAVGYGGTWRCTGPDVHTYHK